eukprot:3442118-Rhodomonas_salina.3
MGGGRCVCTTGHGAHAQCVGEHRSVSTRGSAECAKSAGGQRSVSTTGDGMSASSVMEDRSVSTTSSGLGARIVGGQPFVSTAGDGTGAKLVVVSAWRLRPRKSFGRKNAGLRTARHRAEQVHEPRTSVWACAFASTSCCWCFYDRSVTSTDDMLGSVSGMARGGWATVSFEDGYVMTVQVRLYLRCVVTGQRVCGEESYIDEARSSQTVR